MLVCRSPALQGRCKAGPRRLPAVTNKADSLARASRLYLLALLLLALLLWRWGDAWWPVTVALYAPRWPWALPLAVLLPWALWRGWRRLPAVLAAALVWLLGVAGFNVPAPATWWADSTAADLRVMTYNIGETHAAPQAWVDLLGQLAPDVALLQECSALDQAGRAALKAAGWRLRQDNGACVLTRLPLQRSVALDTAAVWKMGGSGVAVRHDLQAPGLAVSVVNLHLETVRSGLQQVISGGWRGAAALNDVTEQRELEAGLVRAFVAADTARPWLAAGDFNMPDSSAIYRRHFGDWRNAFAQAGWGFGDTKATSWHGIRIDHVLLGPGWAVASARVAPHLGGDHRPLLVDLRWRGR